MLLLTESSITLSIYVGFVGKHWGGGDKVASQPRGSMRGTFDTHYHVHLFYVHMLMDGYLICWCYYFYILNSWLVFDIWKYLCTYVLIKGIFIITHGECFSYLCCMNDLSESSLMQGGRKVYHRILVMLILPQIWLEWILI